MERVLEVKLSRWTKQGEAPEYHRLRNRGPYKPTVMSDLNRFGGQMGPYVDALLQLRSVEYINASLIDNLGEGTPAFVATMCPKRSTFAHFWSMVWETGSQLIINLTHESDKVGSDAADKREQYWPPFDGRMASEAAGWPVRVRTLGCESCAQVPGLHRYALELIGPNAERRRVALYWYSRWLDFPVSSSIGSPPFLANACNVLHVAVHVSHLLASALGAHHRPVCHCSAGVGRTGTLIALLHLLARLPALRTGDDFDACVRDSIERMRERRLWMVKTDVEFALLYAAALQRLRTPSIEVLSRQLLPAIAPPLVAARARTPRRQLAACPTPGPRGADRASPAPFHSPLLSRGGLRMAIAPPYTTCCGVPGKRSPPKPRRRLGRARWRVWSARRSTMRVTCRIMASSRTPRRLHSGAPICRAKAKEQAEGHRTEWRESCARKSSGDFAQRSFWHIWTPRDGA
jgi:protein tyrosine phosphatase